ncbi:NUDIX hydrolase [Streptomyces paromomycinus]|uniref:Putative Nudix hydrolase n=1 Tax=Streptomyces paromomycinus TaxID=92743 RepID=A0A401WDS1_STREY|nr:NUDIX domain-containing protein [Streptomyces paromomycinus]GCD47458.1 putative Nudix hydrolase [Streptomyces paromomycinus]
MTELVDRVDEQDRVVGVADRAEAIRKGWLHRVATVVCRDRAGRILVHRRPADVSRFPNQYNWLIGGAVNAGESYEEAAVRELSEELGVRAAARLAFTFLCRGAIAPYWLGVHEAVIADEVTTGPAEIAWHDWLPEPALREAVRQWDFVPDGRDAFARYAALA